MLSFCVPFLRLDQVERLLTKHDLLATPCVGVLPFDATVRFPAAADHRRPAGGRAVVGGPPLQDPLDWLGQTALFSLTRCPCLALPCGTTRAGLPVSLQVTHSQALLCTSACGARRRATAALSRFAI